MDIIMTCLGLTGSVCLAIVKRHREGKDKQDIILTAIGIFLLCLFLIYVGNKDLNR